MQNMNLTLQNTKSGLPTFILSKNKSVAMPAFIFNEGENAMLKFVDFFIAEIRNPHTRNAYFRASEYFLNWCYKKQINSIHDIKPFMVGAYTEEFSENNPASTVKLHLSGIRRLFNFLVINQIIENNPTQSVKAPQLIRRKGTTPVLSNEEMTRLFASFDTSKLVDLRDRAIIAIMAYSFTRVGAVAKMKVKDYYIQGNNQSLILVEKGTVETTKIAHHKIVEYLDEYIAHAGIANERDTPLFRTLYSKAGDVLTLNQLKPQNIWDMIKKRAKLIGLPSEITCHSFRGTGITNYLSNGGDIEVCAEMANHASIRTTQFYDHRGDLVDKSEVEKVRF